MDTYASACLQICVRFLGPAPIKTCKYIYALALLLLYNFAIGVLFASTPFVGNLHINKTKKNFVIAHSEKLEDFVAS